MYPCGEDFTVSVCNSVIAGGYDKSHYENVPFEVPESWTWTQLGTIISVSSGDGLTSRQMDSNGVIPVYGGNGITGYHNENNVTGPLLVIGRVGFYCGSTHIVDSEAWITDNAFVVTLLNKQISLLWLKYVLDFSDIRHKSSSTAQPVISGKTLYPTLIPLPPLGEQGRIVECLDMLLPMVAKLKADEVALGVLQREFPERMKRSVLQCAFQGKLVPQDPNDEPASVLLERIHVEREALIKAGKIKRNKTELTITKSDDNCYYENLPNGWVVTRLNIIGQIIGGGTPSTNEASYWNGHIPWITPADLSRHNEKFITNGSRKITEKGLAESSAVLMPADSVLFSSRAPIGYCAIAKNEVCTNQGFKSIIPFISGMSEYIYYYLKSQVEEINSRASGTTFKEISGTEFGNTIIMLPSLSEQHRIVVAIELAFEQLKQISKNLS